VTLLLDNDAVRRVLRMDDCVAALAASFGDLAAGNAVDRPRSHTTTDLGDGHHYLFKSMDGALPRVGVHAIRMTSDHTWEHGGRREKIPAAPGHRYVGLVMLFDQRELAPLAIVHDGYLQRMRVGATSALAADKLARPDARVAAVLGAGWQAGAQVEGLRTVRELDEIRVYGPTPTRLERFCLEYRVTRAASVADAVKGADIVACATNSHEPVLLGEHLEPGMHVGSVQGRELDPAVVDRAELVVVRGIEPATFHHVGAAPGEAGQAHDPTPGKVATLADVVAGRAGRGSDEDITLFAGGGTGASSGLGTQFAAVAHAVYERAAAEGIGRELPTEWFTQEEKP
jgi:ornithine cyclodeaminase/alanine dehydrogenase-like protein (mu-crystallin family)